MKKTLEYYMNLNYPIQIFKIPDDEGGGYSASIPILGEYAFLGDGDTIEEAIENLNEVKEALFKEYLEDGIYINEPDEEEQEYSGRFLVRIPKKLHRDLVCQAKENDISLNQFVVYLLTKALELDSVRSIIEKYFNNFIKSEKIPNVQYENRISVKHVSDKKIRSGKYAKKKT